MGYLRDIDADNKLKGMIVAEASCSSSRKTVSAESVSFSAGAAGTTGVVSLLEGPIYNLDGSLIGTSSDTSFAWITGTVLTTEVSYRADWSDALQFAAMSNGEFALDYYTGRIRYKKDTAGVVDTCNYATRWKKVDTELTLHGDIYVDNVKTLATNIADPATQSYGLVDALGWQYVISTNINKPVVTPATGTGAIAATTAIADNFKLNSVTVHFDVAPVSVEDLTITLDAHDGGAYDTVLCRVDPSATSATDIVFIPEEELKFEAGDEIVVAFTNTDLRTYGLRIVTEVL